MEMLKRFVKDERGLEASEYGLLLALIALALVLAIGVLVAAINNAFTEASIQIEPDVVG